MGAREKWNLRGPVRACRIQRTWLVRHCGTDECRSEESGDTTDLEFNEDGTLSRHSHTNPDGSQWAVNYRYEQQPNQRLTVRHIREDGLIVCTSEYDKHGRLQRVISHAADADRTTEEYEYDAAGLKKKTQYVDIAGQVPDTGHAWCIEGSDNAYSAPGTAKLVTVHNDRDKPVELLFYDISDKLLNRVAFTYDADGNLIEELQTRASDSFDDLFSEAPPDQVAVLRAMFQSVSEPLRITHRYDREGRRVETRRQLGLMCDDITTRTYNEQGDEAAGISEDHRREYGVDEQGQLLPVPGSDRVTRSEARFHYEYDEYGNWIMKTVESRPSAEQDFSTSSVERRTIEYFQ